MLPEKPDNGIVDMVVDTQATQQLQKSLGGVPQQQAKGAKGGKGALNPHQLPNAVDINPASQPYTATVQFAPPYSSSSTTLTPPPPIPPLTVGDTQLYVSPEGTQYRRCESCGYCFNKLFHAWCNACHIAFNNRKMSEREKLLP